MFPQKTVKNGRKYQKQIKRKSKTCYNLRIVHGLRFTDRQGENVIGARNRIREFQRFYREREDARECYFYVVCRSEPVQRCHAVHAVLLVSSRDGQFHVFTMVYWSSDFFHPVFYLECSLGIASGTFFLDSRSHRTSVLS